MLEDRFIDPQIFILTHMSVSLSLEPVYSISELKYFRKLVDKVETCKCVVKKIWGSISKIMALC